jgi:hypothetical protein
MSLQVQPISLHADVSTNHRYHYREIHTLECLQATNETKRKKRAAAHESTGFLRTDIHNTPKRNGYKAYATFAKQNLKKSFILNCWHRPMSGRLLLVSLPAMHS